MAILADDDVVMHRDAERAGDRHDRLRELDVGGRRRRITRRVIVHNPTAFTIVLIFLYFFMVA